MERVYLLIDTASGTASTIAEVLRTRLGASMVDAVAGPHDVIAVLDRTEASLPCSTTLEDIRAIEGVKYVTVCTAVRKPA
jgi:hypothetical protein